MYDLRKMVMGLRLVVLMEFMILLNVLLALKATAATVDLAKPGCQSQCGTVSIPYPFGTGGHCNISEDFFIRCNTTSRPIKAFYGDFEIVNISLDGQIRVLVGAGYDCYNTSGPAYNETYGIELSKFSINNTRNKFTAIGCDTYARVVGIIGQGYATGCLSLCSNITDVTNGSCSGIGCCQTSIPKSERSYFVILDSYANHSLVLPENPCSYAFVAEDDAYTFSISDIRGYSFQDKEFPVTLDWTIGNKSCNEAKMDTENFACKDQYSNCVDSENDSGYFCKCFEGFEGSPYLPNGCQDINECETLRLCNATCLNIPGSFHCSCPEGYEGDGWKNGTGCSLTNKPQGKRSPLIDVALGTTIGFLVLVLGIVLLYLMFRQRQISKLRETYFQQNGGNMLREQLSVRQGYRENVKIFAAEELEKATNNYHESRILGQGGQGTVYEGILADGRIVAIKKSRIGDHSQVEQFINEIMVLYQINHRNVVKLLGCCLETQVPLLVYEYITNGTLFDHLHGDDAVASDLPWETRLRIATETAEALSYLHSATSVPIIHRDIKLANILLDDNYNAKVSDFGASRLNPSDQTQISTIVQGTFGYLDPEYMLSSLLTEKSDVYSFGVVLMELLTGQKVVCFERSEENRVLAMYFVSLMKEDRLMEILDPRMMNVGNVKQLKEVASLARRCVRVKGEERPTMKEVAHELAGLQAMARHPWGESNLQGEEAEYLLGDMCSTYGDGATSSSMGYESINNKVTFELDGAR